MLPEPDDPTEAALLLDLERWEAEQPKDINIFDVLHTGDVGLIAAYVLREFRAAAAEAVESRNRVMQVRAAVLETHKGDAEQAESFLRQPHPELGQQTPLQRAGASEAGKREVLELTRKDGDR